MKEIAIAATRRNESGKGSARRTRMAGEIPGIVYGPETDPISVAVNQHDFSAAMKKADAATILNLTFDGQERKVIVRDMQRDPLTSRVIHLDFHAISMDKPINVSIPIKFVGTPVGVKTDGGIMQATMRELDIYCLPINIPDDFEIDVSELGIGESIHVSELEIPNVEIASEARRTVVTIAAPTVIKAATTDEEEGEEAEEGVEGAEGEEAAAEGAEEGGDEAKKAE